MAASTGNTRVHRYNTRGHCYNTRGHCYNTRGHCYNTRGQCYIIRCVGLVLLAFHFAEADEASTATEIPKRVLKGIKSLTAPSVDGLNQYSLPTNVEPTYYHVTLTPIFYGVDPQNFTFSGKVNIKLKCHAESSEITLHSVGLNLEIDKSHFYDDGSKDHTEYTFDLSQEEGSPFLKVILNSNMKKGRMYWLSLHFNAPLGNDAKGLYYTQYKTGKTTGYVVASRFIPTYARRVFPCFDEPALKTPFRLTITRPDDYVALSNTDLKPQYILKDRIENGIKLVHDEFKVGPQMSTFALAIFIGEIDDKKDIEGNYTYRSFTKHDVRHLADYARRSTKLLTKAFTEHFNIPFTLRKSDIVAAPVPETTLHWGLDLFRDTSMLNENNGDVEEEKADMQLLMARKTAHVYFGNLVTPLWWDDLWLMEGMSSYYQYWGPLFHNNTWKTWEKFILDKVHPAFQLDDVLHGKPVIRVAETVDEIENMFDWVVFTKAPVLIRMMSFIVGDVVFETAVKTYLLKYSGNVATTKDLIAEIQKEVKAKGSSLNVSDIMDTWFLEPNYPLVTVTRDFHNHSLIRVSQKRFFEDVLVEGSYKYAWTIPLTFMTSVSPNVTITNKDIYWLGKNQVYRELTINNPLPGCSDPDGWILLNVNQHGYYRVNYQTGNWLALVKQLRTKHNVIPTINRAQIINDAWALSKAEKYIPFNIALETLDYLEAERDFLPWQTAAAEFHYLESRFSYTTIYGGLKMFMRKKLETPFVELKKRDEKIHSYSLIKIAEQACYYDVDECVKLCRTHYTELLHRPLYYKIPPQIMRLVNCIAIANGDWKEFRLAAEIFSVAETDAKKLDSLYAMSCTRKPWIINVLLGMLLDDNVQITPENALNLLTFVMKNPYGRYLAWDYYRNNYFELSYKYPTLSCDNALPVITRLFNTHMESMEVMLFALKQCTEAGDVSLIKPVVTIFENIEWTKDNSPIIKAWLKDKEHFIP